MDDKRGNSFSNAKTPREVNESQTLPIVHGEFCVCSWCLQGH
jgi:hypothetical protein